MRRIMIVILLCLLLTTAVSAESYVSKLESSTEVASNGTCEVTVTLQLELEEVPGELWFPLPRAARDITVNRDSVSTRTSSVSRDADLSDQIHSPGTHTLVIQYSLPDAVSRSGGKLVLNLQILNGFRYSIEKMNFTVTLPGEPQSDPDFVSTYYQEDVESLMETRFSGNTISCTINQRLKDHESLKMSLAVTEEMFPQSVYKRWSLSTDDVAMYACTVLALLYWLVFLRAMPRRSALHSKGPEGINPGEYPSVLAGRGIDFSAMVVGWARMGYLQIRVEHSGKVLLQKRMDMGNERSDAENHFFRLLFQGRTVVNGTGQRYAQLCRKASATRPGVSSYFRKQSGNPYIFRIFAAAVGLFGGISLARAMAADTGSRTLLGVLFGILCTGAAWQIHAGAACLGLRRKGKLSVSLVISALWLLVSTWAGEPGVAVYILIVQWLAGFAAAYGGRRTDLGRQVQMEAFGLRRYLRSVSRTELQRISQSHPEYFYDMVPYALVMGVEKSFARRFGDLQLPECTFLTTPMDESMTASEWVQVLRAVVQTMDATQTRQILARLRGR